MKLDPTVLVALVSLVGLIISGGFGVVVAIVTNRKEKTTAAESAADQTIEKAAESMEDALRERILLRDEQNAALKLRIADLEADNERLRRQARERDE